GSGMDEEEREECLSACAEGGKETVIGFCVMGGIFAEGIALTGERLIGAVVVGTGLPQVCREQELYKDYFDEKNGRGFDYAYLYNGMNKVLQSAGRVIRTTEDTGVIVLLDERFEREEYKNLFPREWFPYEKVTKATVRKRLDEFWSKYRG
ncbi:MAG: ATP-dependent DNA helicase, partial [Lachnospiraceae bacterium]|nr:ATP-dependent DNA helicase [Lachnospiraceae bacterium]